MPVTESLITLSALAWAGVLLLPWQPWRTRQVLESEGEGNAVQISDVTVLIPARNEAALLPRTLRALAEQDDALHIVLIDDESTDGTANSARQSGIEHLKVISSAPLPQGWSGKMWALHQGFEHVHTPLILLLDADIELLPGMLAGLRRKIIEGDLNMVSVMAKLPTQGLWERLLLPAFVYFFRLMYPFKLANSPHSPLAAAAGGCLLVKRDALERAGGFSAIRDAVIDDCALAQRIKDTAGGVWLGLTHGAISRRRCLYLTDIVNMVARTAFEQLRHSLLLLMLCSVAMLILFFAPLVALYNPTAPLGLIVSVWLLMTASYVPTLNFYKLSPLWALLLPVIGSVYLASTWISAWRYWRGERTRWKRRTYARTAQEGKREP
ncbi:MAG: glycosyltransferase [Mariprofundaceae bacterium]